MAEKMSKHQIIVYIAEKTGVTQKVAGEMLDALVDLAYQQAKHQFTIPGLGVISMSERSERKMVMRFGAKAGQQVVVPAKKVLKFRFSKPAKDAIMGPVAVKKDDLALIEGIGPKIADCLHASGILTFNQLAKTPVEKLRQILTETRFLGDPSTWPEQAGLAAEGKMEELKKLQDALQGGRRV